MTFLGWGIVGAPQDGVIDGDGYIDVTGYHAGDYWDGDTFLGPDPFGIVPIYDRGCDQFPANARPYPYQA